MRLAGEPSSAEEPRPAFPWDDVLDLGLGLLRWRPRDVWDATPLELAAALGRRSRAEPLTRTAFELLLAAHPDPIDGGSRCPTRPLPTGRTPPG